MISRFRVVVASVGFGLLWFTACGGATTLAADASSSSIVPVPEPGMETRRAEKLEAVKQRRYDLMLIGDSITQTLEWPEFAAVWNQYYAPRNPIGLGYSGGRTENTLWNLTHGELEGQSPKVAVVLIGTNNCDDANFPVAHTAEEIAAGTKAIVQVIREKCPTTKILLLRIFPRNSVYKNADGTERGNVIQRSATIARASDLVSQLADGVTTFFLDVNHVFLRLDGTIDPALMPDLLHPSPAGALAWARGMEPTLSELFGDKNRNTEPTHSALVPATKLENDFYDWFARHDACLKAKDSLNPDLVFLGDSITHFWGGPPMSPNQPQYGAKSLTRHFGNYRVLNLGFGWDRTQNVLWRLDHGAFDRLQPKFVILNIGTNNFSRTEHAPENSPAEVAEGVKAILLRLRAKSPQSRIILMGVFPRGEKPEDPYRAKIIALNELLSEYGKVPGITFLDIGSKLRQSDGTVSRSVMPDFVHPNEAGYDIWGEALLKAMR